VYHTKEKGWSFSSQMKKIDAEQALNTMTSFKDIFAGTLSGKIQARGNAAKKGLEHLTTQGLFTIEKGRVNNLDMVKSTVDGLTGIQGLSGMISPEYGAVRRNIETRFDSLSMDFNLVNKVMNLPSIKLVNIYTGKETNTISTLKGKVDMASRKIDLDGSVAFSPDYSSRIIKRAPAFNALVNSEKRVDIPVRIAGPVNKPVLTPHASAISQAVAGYYARKGVESVEKKIKEKLKLPGDTKLPKSPVDNLLKGVFGK
jgi:hypothetical protein